MTPEVLAAGQVGAPVLIELGALLLGLALMGQAALRAGLPTVPFYLLGGLAFGTGGLVPLQAPEAFIEVGAEIGVLLLLLMLGLEYTGSELASGLRTHVPSGLLDLLLCAGPGLAAGLLLGWSPAAAVALAGVTYISSSGIVSKLLSDLGRLGNRESPAVLAVLVLEDLAMVVYLPVLAAVLAGAGLLAGGLSVALGLSVAVGMLLVATRWGHHVTRLLGSRDPENLVLRLLGVTLLISGLAQAAQVSAAVGAFLVGIALSGEVADGARTLLAPLRDLFAAVFFVFFGLQTDPGLLPPVLGTALLLALVGLVGKMVVGWYAAAQVGVASRGRVRAGTALVSRGEFSIVIAGLAVQADVEPALGPLAAAYVLVLAIGGPLLARAAEPLHDLLTRSGRVPGGP